MVHKYTLEQIEFIREVAPGKYNVEITELFNAAFGTSLSEGQIKSTKANYKIKSNVPTNRKKEDGGLFTKEQKDFIRLYAKGLSNQALTDLVNQTFQLNMTKQQIKRFKHNHKISSGLTGHFNKGHAPVNKGTKGMFNVGGNKTSFKKGQRPKNFKPVGTERIERDGYILVKVSNTGAWHERWRLKQVVLWEEANGPIPEGHCLLFLDGNRQNVSLDNLQLISRSQLARLNKLHLIQNDADLTKAGIVIADIYGKIAERKKAM